MRLSNYFTAYMFYEQQVMPEGDGWWWCEADVVEAIMVIAAEVNKVRVEQEEQRQQPQWH